MENLENFCVWIHLSNYPYLGNEEAIILFLHELVEKIVQDNLIMLKCFEDIMSQKYIFSIILAKKEEGS